MLLQSVLVGKAREIYTQLTVEQAVSYDTVKELIHNGYELVPEAYRQKFRNCEKLSNQTYVEFARSKEQLFDRWCCSQKVDKSNDKLRQLILRWLDWIFLGGYLPSLSTRSLSTEN